MNFEEYQKESRKTAVYSEIGKGFVYPALGLAGEAGEVAEKVKKIFRDEKGEVSETKRLEIKKELGDVLWYVSQLATEFGLELDAIALHNLEKLSSRQERGTLNGNGDNR